MSTEDYTTAEKTKLSGIATGATNVTIDNTVSITGQAADAGAVRTALNSKISNVTVNGTNVVTNKVAAVTVPTVTNSITQGSTDAVTSGAVYSAIGDIESLLAAI